MHTLELRNPKALVRPSQTESTKVKNVIIGDERPEKKLTQKKVPQATTETSMFVGKDKKKKTDSKLTSLTNSNVSLTDTPTDLTGVLMV